MSVDRRKFVKSGALAALSFKVAGCDMLLSPREARERAAELRTVGFREAQTLDRLAEALLPGARDAGFTEFIDAQISGAPGDFLGVLKYMDWPPPYAAFYRDGAAALDALARARHDAPFARLDDPGAAALIRDISGAQPEGWSGPPAPLFYFVARSDAIDVYYGTEEGFARLGVPYIPHIAPERPW